MCGRGSWLKFEAKIGLLSHPKSTSKVWNLLPPLLGFLAEELSSANRSGQVMGQAETAGPQASPDLVTVPTVGMRRS